MAEFDPGLDQGQVIAGEELQRIFKCSGQGGMRRAHRTNTLVLIAKTSGGTCVDRWEGKVFHYTGLGLVGDQEVDRAQNKTLAGSDTNGVTVFLLENLGPNAYESVGRVALAGAPYPETQADRGGNDRRVWVSPLRVVLERAKSRRELEDLARDLSQEDLEKLIGFARDLKRLRES